MVWSPLMVPWEFWLRDVEARLLRVEQRVKVFMYHGQVLWGQGASS